MVKPDHRDFLRFLWFKDSDIDKQVIREYRMKVHVFGNSPSPAVTTYGLRKAAKDGELRYGKDAREFVERNFYVDDGLVSLPTVPKAISLIARTKEMLGSVNLRLHKLVSNSREVLQAFPPAERASDLDLDGAPLQHSLGVFWDVSNDALTFKTSDEMVFSGKPFTKRGVLSVINSVFDPLGLAQPAVITGKILLRKMTSMLDNIGWDDPLPADLNSSWVSWCRSLDALQQIQVPRCYTPIASTESRERELHIYVDASELAIAAVAYLRVIDSDDRVHVSFVLGKAKLAPKQVTTIPRLELNSAVLGVEIAEVVLNELDLKVDWVQLHCDSKVTLAYIANRTKIFYVYVANRVQRILHSTEPSQWTYVNTANNPADVATRPSPTAGVATQLKFWLEGPDELRSGRGDEPESNQFYIPQDDGEVRDTATVLATQISKDTLGSPRFLRFSRWKSVVKAMAHLIHIAHCFSHSDEKNRCRGKGWHLCSPTVDEMDKAKKLILREAQTDSFIAEIQSLKGDKVIPKDSVLKNLDPYLDDSGVLRIGGRLRRSQLDMAEKHPALLAKSHHVATLLVRHFHEVVQHQGRQLTAGALRSGGFWITGARHLVGSTIEKCVPCRKQRWKLSDQKMADLPEGRVIPNAPFTHVGVDVFGPWMVMHRTTRSHRSQAKRCGLIFTCLGSRAVHIEVLDSMDASAFINAARRFLAIRGPVKRFYSDCGTNFVAGSKELDIAQVKRYLVEQHECEWTFNPPRAPHMGGVWERMVATVKRILSVMLAKLGPTHLTHDVLHTFLAEVSAIVNARPLVPVSSDPQCPGVLSPATLLTQKIKVLTAPPGVFDEKDMFGKQWRRVQYLAEVFWGHWKREYLPTLQARQKWLHPRRNAQVGDLVLIHDDSLPRNKWRMGRIESTSPDDQDRVRSVTIKTNSCVLKRPIHKTVLLIPVEDQ